MTTTCICITGKGDIVDIVVIGDIKELSNVLIIFSIFAEKDHEI